MRQRGGFSWLTLLAALAVATALPLAAYFWAPRDLWKPKTTVPLTHEVRQTVFRHIITERGEIESSSNVEVRCEVQNRATGGGGGTAILEIVPEGTYVQPGDFIARLDSSALEDELNRQEITCNSSRAAVIQAENQLEAARISKREYMEGTFKQEEQTVQAEISVAEENLRRAEDFAHHSRLLAARGYVTPVQLKADEFAVEKAQMDLSAANTKLDVLRRFTLEKMIGQFDADIKTAEANLESQRSIHELDLSKLKLVQEQVDKCYITAPSAGQVVYANESDRRGGSEVIIEPGVTVRERQVIVRLPDPKRMRVKASINEARIDRVRVRMPAIVRVDAFPELELKGIVSKVEEYPIAGNWWSSVKEYSTIVDIANPPEGLRAGMTAEVQILVAELPEALQVPVQAVLEHGGMHYCLRYTAAGGFESVEVAMGATDDKYVVINGGLEARDRVVLNPRAYLERVDLPDVAPMTSAAGEVFASIDTSDLPAVGSPAAPRGTQTASAGGAGAAPGAGGSDDESAARRRAAADAANMSPEQLVARTLEQFDTNGDGVLSAEELESAPEQIRSGLLRGDANGDGQLDREELRAAMARFAAMMRGGGAGAPGAGPGGGPPAGGGGR